MIDIHPADVEVITSIIHKGRIAPKGTVYYIAKTGYAKQNWELAKLVNRTNVPQSMENQFVESFKTHFITSIENKLKETAKQKAA